MPRDFEVVPLVSFLNHAAAPNCHYLEEEAGTLRSGRCEEMPVSRLLRRPGELHTRVAAAAQGRGGDSGLPPVPGDAGRCIDRMHTHTLLQSYQPVLLALAARRRPLAHTPRTMRRVNFEFIEPALSPCAPAPCAPQEADSYTYQQVAAGFRGKPKTYL